jgi:hypothetical protein
MIMTPAEPGRKKNGRYPIFRPPFSLSLTRKHRLPFLLEEDGELLATARVTKIS